MGVRQGRAGPATGEVKLDFTHFDREARRYFDERQVFSAFNFAPTSSATRRSTEERGVSRLHR